MTNSVQVNLDLPAGMVGGDFAGAFSSAASVVPARDAASVTVTATDATPTAPYSWSFQFAYSGFPNRRLSVSSPVPAGPVTFAVNSAALSSLVFTADNTWVNAFPSGIPVGTQVTLAGGSLPSGLSAATPYYVVSTALGSLSLSATAGGSAITCTGPGSGTFTVTQYNYTGLLAAAAARATTTPSSLPYPAGTATPGNLVAADDNGSPVWQAPAGTVYNHLTPADLGLLAWTFPPHEYTTTFTTRTGNGWFYAWRFKTGPACTVNNISYCISTAATGTSMANVFLGIYDDTSTLLGSCSTDQAANFAIQGNHTCALSAPLTLAANTVYRIGMCIGTPAGTGQPVLTSGAASSSGAFSNTGVPSGKMVGVASQNSYTSLPSPLVFSTIGSQAALPVFVLT